MVLLKVRHNKRTNQLDVALPRKKLNLRKNKVPKFIEIKEVNFLD